MKLLIMQSSPASRHFLLLTSKYYPHYPVLNTLNLCPSLNVSCGENPSSSKALCNIS